MSGMFKIAALPKPGKGWTSSAESAVITPEEDPSGHFVHHRESLLLAGLDQPRFAVGRGLFEDEPEIDHNGLYIDGVPFDGESIDGDPLGREGEKMREMAVVLL